MAAIISNGMKHSHLPAAKRAKNSEFKTRYIDIMQEICHYSNAFSGKVVYCNCDDEDSNFRNFFLLNFTRLNLKKLYCTGISGNYLEYDGKVLRKDRVNGDFRSKFCQRLIEQADILVTNPPFALLSEWFQMTKGKDYLIVAPKTAVSLKAIFPSIKSGVCKIGHTMPDDFLVNKSKVGLQGLCRWFTTLPVIGKQAMPLPNKQLNKYERFDLYPAINVDHIKEIPVNYSGLMGVPISFMDYMDYDRFEIIDHISRYGIIDRSYDVKGHQLTEINGKPKFARIIIRRIR